MVKKDFTDEIKDLEMGRLSEQAPHATTRVLIEERQRECSHRESREGNVNVEAETAVMWPQAKTAQKPKPRYFFFHRSEGQKLKITITEPHSVQRPCGDLSVSSSRY